MDGRQAKQELDRTSFSCAQGSEAHAPTGGRPCLLTGPRDFEALHQQVIATIPAFSPELEVANSRHRWLRKDARQMLEVGGGRLGPLLQRENCLLQTYCVFKLYFLEKGKSRINCRQGARLLQVPRKSRCSD
ncbi:hypothetical protein ACRRTK_010957 [Alexandromys fortis]